MVILFLLSCGKEPPPTPRRRETGVFSSSCGRECRRVRTTKYCGSTQNVGQTVATINLFRRLHLRNHAHLTLPGSPTVHCSLFTIIAIFNLFRRLHLRLRTFDPSRVAVCSLYVVHCYLFTIKFYLSILATRCVCTDASVRRVME